MSDGNTEKNRRIREKPTQRRKQSLLATCSREMCAACAVCLPTVEVRLSNMHRRESFRARTFSSRGVDGVICSHCTRTRGGKLQCLTETRERSGAIRSHCTRLPECWPHTRREIAMSDGNTEKNRRIREKPTQRRKQSLPTTCSREMCAACAVCLPTVEVHLSNMHRRESFRARTFSSRGVDGVIRGLGAARTARACRNAGHTRREIDGKKPHDSAKEEKVVADDMFPRDVRSVRSLLAHRGGASLEYASSGVVSRANVFVARSRRRHSWSGSAELYARTARACRNAATHAEGNCNV